MDSSSSISGTVNWKEFVTAVESNQFLQDEGTDTSLQPGEEYLKTPHPYMVSAHKLKSATMNQISQLIDTKPTDHYAKRHKPIGSTRTPWRTPVVAYHLL